jgi:hypothetical protein
LDEIQKKDEAMYSRAQIQPNVQSKRYSSQKPKVSIILVDRGVCESFHSLDYLNDQTANRSDYELIWIERYENIPKKLEKKVAEYDKKSLSAVDQLVTLGFPEDCYYHKHFAYNVGIALARGDICVICDSNAMFPDLFVEKIISKFAENENENIVLHIDQIINTNKKFHPFKYPSFDKVTNDEKTINWCGDVTQGLNDSLDMLHEANYGACMAAKKEHLLEICGADEHMDYLGSICGPYELTFRLINWGCEEIWLRDLFLIQTWHPSEDINANFVGPEDGRGISSRALEAKLSGRTHPCTVNSVIKAINTSKKNYAHQLLIDAFNLISINNWSKNLKQISKPSVPALIDENIKGNNIIHFNEYYYAFPQSEGAFLLESAASGKYEHLMRNKDLELLRKDISTIKNMRFPKGMIYPKLLSYIRKITIPS